MRLLLLVLGLLLAAGGAAAARPAPEPATPALWVLADEDTTIHIFGTVHALPRGTGWFRPHVVDALDRADLLILETVLPGDPVAMMGLTLRMARRPQPEPVAARVPETSRPALEAALARLKPGPLDGFKTWFVALTLANLQSAANGLDPAIGVEAVLIERARLRKIPVEGLETVEQQLTYFDALSEADQRLFLVATLDGLADSRAETEAMVADWLAGRKDRLAERINRDFEGSPMLKQMLLGDRNARWAAWIAERMQKPGRVFLAVGAGHLAGPGNLVDLLERRYGLAPERVLLPPPAPARAPRRRN
ncbi:MAG: TraB/GumN family protein [Thermaurantiacus tibetensis]|uniref:TraB/GumN family protein n=1 Tax=Thermaurantiacus tibetensis TaxID=2759035 RepID=UPI00188E360A|nr:TraB/GumN family protein [Thermaurantiacus tibetensis]